MQAVPVKELLGAGLGAVLAAQLALAPLAGEAVPALALHARTCMVLCTGNPSCCCCSWCSCWSRAAWQPEQPIRRRSAAHARRIQDARQQMYALSLAFTSCGDYHMRDLPKGGSSLDAD